MTLHRMLVLSMSVVGLTIGLGVRGAQADVIVTLGDQDFADVTPVAGVAAFEGPSVGEPAPFNLFCGSDFGNGCSTSFTFNYAPGATTAAQFTVGIFDGDSGLAGNQLTLFTFDGFDFTSALNALMETANSLNGQYNVYTLALSGGILAALADGSATAQLQFTNGVGLDFSRLQLTTNVAAVPEPASLSLFACGLAGIATRRWRQRKSA
jgi:hypothetical protein